MADRWRTNSHTPGRYSVFSMTHGFVKDGVVVHGSGIIGEGCKPIPRCDHKRLCQECGKEVSTYKDVHMEKVWCYACDHLTPGPVLTWLDRAALPTIGGRRAIIEKAIERRQSE